MPELSRECRGKPDWFMFRKPYDFYPSLRGLRAVLCSLARGFFKEAG